MADGPVTARSARFTVGDRKARMRFVHTATPADLEAFVSVLYLSTDDDRELLARMFVLEAETFRHLLGRRYVAAWGEDFERDHWSEEDLRDGLPHLLRLAVARDLATLLAFMRTLDRVEEELALYEEYMQGVCHSTMFDMLVEAVIRNPEMRIAFPELPARVAEWAKGHHIDIFDVFARAEKRGLVAQLDPAFFDEVDADVMKRRADPGLTASEDRDILETVRQTELVGKHFPAPRRDVLVGVILATSRNPACRAIGAHTQGGMSLHLREAIVDAAGNAPRPRV